MRRISIIISIFLMVSLIACGNEPQSSPENESQPITENELKESTDIISEDTNKTEPEEPEEVEEITEEFSSMEESEETDSVQNYTVSSIDEFAVNDSVYQGDGENSLYYIGEAQIVEYPAEYDGKPVQIIGGGEYIINMYYGEGLPCTETVVKVIIPEGVRVLYNATVFYYNKLEIIELPDSLQEIREKALIGIKNPCNVTVPDNTEIQENAFFDCEGLIVTYKGEAYSKDNDPYGWWGE